MRNFNGRVCKPKQQGANPLLMAIAQGRDAGAQEPPRGTRLEQHLWAEIQEHKAMRRRYWTAKGLKKLLT